MSQKHNRDSEQNVVITSSHPRRRDGGWIILFLEFASRRLPFFI